MNADTHKPSSSDATDPRQVTDEEIDAMLEPLDDYVGDDPTIKPLKAEKAKAKGDMLADVTHRARRDAEAQAAEQGLKGREKKWAGHAAVREARDDFLQALAAKAVAEAPAGKEVTPEEAKVLKAKEVSMLKSIVREYLAEKSDMLKQGMMKFFGVSPDEFMTDTEYQRFLDELQTPAYLMKHDNPTLDLWAKRVKDHRKEAGQNENLANTPHMFMVRANQYFSGKAGLA